MAEATKFDRSLAQLDRAAAAIANARGMRRGMPPIKNILDLLPEKLRQEVRDDAAAALDAVGFDELVEACKAALALSGSQEPKTPVPLPDEPGFREAVEADLRDYLAECESVEAKLRAAIAKAEGRG